MKTLFIILVAMMFTPAYAGPVITYDFATAEQEALFNKLSDELRCLVCQNQAISDSNADLAKDLRDEIYTMLQQGQSEDQIVEFMVARYGDFVLYRPPMKPVTWLLWFGPALALIVGFFVVMRIVNKQKQASAVEISGEDIERLKALQAETQAVIKNSGDGKV
ncbi:MAG: cytochrome c-type biogenesis protein [Gammaproteobacteria bacterium]